MNHRVLASLLIGGAAFGQLEDAVCTALAPCPPNLELELFEPALGTDRFLTVEGPNVPKHLMYDVGTQLGYQRTPLAVFTTDGDSVSGEQTALVEGQTSLRLMGAVGLFHRFQVGLDLPIMLAQSGAYFNLPAGQDESAAGLGDPRIHLKAKLLGNGTWGVAFAPVITVPASGGNGFRGSDNASVRPRVLGAYRIWKVSAAANLGYLVREKTQILSSEVDDQLLYGLAAAYQVNQPFRVVAELFGRSGLNSNLAESPAEIDGAAEYEVYPDFKVLVGLGAGIIQGLGSPPVRVFAQVHWSPDTTDEDNDGVRDRFDRCLGEPEDRDGFRDDDGCPDLDNDEDLIPDEKDKCPDQPEDKDTFQDDDGCPDEDNDGDSTPDLADECPFQAGPVQLRGCPADVIDTDEDGLPDVRDKCKEDPEDIDNFEDDDGCPDIDNDGDEVPDALDDCPNDAEDMDGFQDDDGCPDLDNDADGIPDDLDQCQGEKETINGREDYDGCADLGAPDAEVKDGGLVLHLPILFTSRESTTLKGRSETVLGQIALLLLAHKELKRVAIEVHADDSGDEEESVTITKAQAEALREKLIAGGVSEQRLVAVGFGAANPIDSNKTRAGRKKNRRVEFRVLQ